MAWSPGQSGNPDGRQKSKPWRDALQRALGKIDADGKRPRLELIAEKVVTAAEEGDRDAWKEIADRLDGKVPQGIIGGDEDDPAIKATVTLVEVVAKK